MIWFSFYAVDKIKALVIAWNTSLNTDAAFFCKNEAHQPLRGPASLFPSIGKCVGHVHLQPSFLPVKVFLLEALSRSMRQKSTTCLWTSASLQPVNNQSCHLMNNVPNRSHSPGGLLTEGQWKSGINKGMSDHIRVQVGLSLLFLPYYYCYSKIISKESKESLINCIWKNCWKTTVAV